MGQSTLRAVLRWWCDYNRGLPLRELPLPPDHTVSRCYGYCFGKTPGGHDDDAGAHHDHRPVGDFGGGWLDIATIRPHLHVKYMIVCIASGTL